MMSVRCYGIVTTKGCALPVLGDGVPVAEVLPGEVERECLGRTSSHALAFEVPENANGIVGATKADVKLCNLVAINLAVVGDVGSDGEEDLVEACVASEAVGRASGKAWLRGAVGAVGGPSVVESILRVVGGSLQVGAVQARVDVSEDELEALWAEVVSCPVADGAIGRCGGSLASGRLVGRCVTGGDL